MANSHTNSKGVTYYFHKKGHLQYFSKDANGAIEIPAEFEVIENQKTGLPIARRKK
ncbi:MAG: hypothetical protein PHD29_07465 [bacterium]|jgi:hypothetical protein|nr:hypothetical protein [bacterium]MDD5757033.1 hypothetical protein [bacterium]